eukprot:s324_g19.t1
MKADIQKHEATPGCHGCAAIEVGGAAVAHDSKCRARMVALVDPERVKRHSERMKSRADARQEEILSREGRRLGEWWGYIKFELYNQVDYIDAEFYGPVPFDRESPVRPFTVLRNLNRRHLSNERNLLARERGARHLHLCVEWYRRRHLQGKYFLHEHPASAGSWDDEEVQKLQGLDGIFTASGPMCAWGMGMWPKPTMFITNSLEIVKVLGTHCANRRGGPIHRHISLVGGLANLRSEYPQEMVNAVLEGLKRQMLEDGALSAVEAYSSGPVPTEPVFPKEWRETVEGFYDGISGELIPADGVRKARMEEIAWVHKTKLYDKVKAVGRQGLEGQDEGVAHQLFSATRPWEMVKPLFSLLVTDLPEEFGGNHSTVGIPSWMYSVNRAVTLGEDGGGRWVRIEPDKRHIELIAQGVGVSLKSTGVTTQAIKPTDAQASALERLRG